MGSKIKEDERTEKAIRNLLKLPENRRCINCNCLGPQYVCSTFWTFVCTNCSGIHREFTHRVKSISMAKFTTEEVSALREGGNKRAKLIYFKELNTQRDGYPDGSNIFKLRDFIRSVYVEKRYTNDSESNDKISNQKPAVIEDYRENKKGNASNFGSKSLNSLDKSENAIGRSGNESLKFYLDDKKHKQQQQHVTHNLKSRGLPKSPIRFEIVDDRFRDDGAVKKYDGRRESRGNSKSLDLSNNKDTLSFPIVRHASELLGDNVPHLRVDNVVKVEKRKDPVAHQVTASSAKVENLGSLIDDVPVSEHSDDRIRQTSSELPSATVKRTEEPAPNSLEALLFGLDVPSVVPVTNNYELWNQSEISPTASATNLETQLVSRTLDTVTSSVTSPVILHAGSSGPAFSVAADNLNNKDMALAIVAANNQVESTISPKGPKDTSMEQSIMDISTSVHGVESEHHYHQDETQSSIRKALPEDLFTGGFSFASQQVHGQHYGMGYGMQYYQYPVNTGAFTYTAKPSNPFDISCDDAGPNQAPQFPSMAYTQAGGMTHVPVPRGFSDSSSPVAVMASQSLFYTTPLSPNSPSLGSNLSPGAFMGQQSQVNMSSSFRQEMSGFNTVENTFHQANNNGYSSANPNAYISKGNPFE